MAERLVEYECVVLFDMAAAFWVWLWIDLLLLFKTKEYSLLHFKIFALGSNCIALFTMIYLQWNAVLR